MERELPPLNALRAFEAVARLGSVNAAAGELHVTHGAVSRQLKALENALGQPLVAKQGRGIALTPLGQRLRDSTLATFGQLRADWAALRREQAQAPFVLGCSGSLLARWMIPRLDRLRHDLPGFVLHLSAQEAPFAADLAGIDAALLLASRPFPAGWQVHPLAVERIGPVVSPRYGGLAWKDRPASALHDEPLLHTTSRPQAWPSWWQRAGLDLTHMSIGQGFEHLYYLLEAAIAGLGVAIAPEPLVAQDLAAGRLSAPWGFVDTEAYWVLAAPERTTDARLARLRDWLQQEWATPSA